MSDENIEADFTRYTILTIFFVGMGVSLYAINIDLLTLVNQSVNSFYSTSSIVFSLSLIHI